VVSDVFPQGPAARAGLRIADLVLKLDGKVMENARQFEVNLYPRAVGETVGLEVRRGAQKLTFRVMVSERPRDPDRLADQVSPEKNAIPKLGLLALDLDDALAQMLAPLRARAGVVVAATTADGPSGSDALLPGDVIYTLNQEPVVGIESLRETIAHVKPGDPVVFHLERNGELRFVTLELE
jgi:serine protease Do